MIFQKLIIKKKFFSIIFFFSLKLIILSSIYQKLRPRVYPSSGLNLINFADILCPKQEYDTIFCKKSLKIYVSTTICLHDIKRDFTSRQIFLHGVKEKYFVKMFLNYLSQHRDSFFIDIGAHIGMYSLYAAKLGRDVVAVEAFYENIIRLQKAARLENLENKITLINNAISNIANSNVTIKYHLNIGEQSLFRQELAEFKETDKRYVVKTIIFDDILAIIPKQANGKEYQRAVLKIDIEGYEPYAFIHSKKLFEKFNFELILMEWYQVNIHREHYLNEIDLMLSFLTQNGYNAYDNGKKLEITDWKNWPRDIYWTRE